LDGESLLALYAAATPHERRRIARWALEDRPRKAPLSGADLVAQGLAGPAVGAALARLRAAWLDGAVRSRDEALALARELAASALRAPRASSRAKAKESTGAAPRAAREKRAKRLETSS
jgi:hypothetical protein